MLGAAALRAGSSLAWPSAVGLWAGLLLLGPISEIADRESPQDAARHDRSGAPPIVNADARRTLQREGFVVLDGALSEPLLAAARRDCAALAACGELARTEQHSRRVRSDCVCWITERGEREETGTRPDGSAPALAAGDGLRAALRRLRGIAAELNGGGGDGTIPWSGFALPQCGAAAATVEAVPLLAWWAAVSKAMFGPPHALGVPRSAQLASFSASGGGGEAAAAAAATTAAAAAAIQSRPRPPPLPLSPEAEDCGGAFVEGNGDDDDADDAPPLVERYAAHRDALLTSPFSLKAISMAALRAREVTAILYLNDRAAWGWPDVGGGGGGQTADVDGGGSLVLYLGADPSDETGASAARRLEIQPMGGRLVLFDSRVVLHEVRARTGGRWFSLVRCRSFERPSLRASLSISIGASPSSGISLLFPSSVRGRIEPEWPKTTKHHADCGCWLLAAVFFWRHIVPAPGTHRFSRIAAPPTGSR